jgi:hypothetical protein
MRFITILISLMITSVSFGLDFSFLNNPDREFIPQSVWPDSKIDNLNFVDFEGDGFDDLIVVFNRPHRTISDQLPADTLAYLHFNKLYGTEPVLFREFYYETGVFSGGAKTLDIDNDGSMDMFIGFNDSTALYLLHFPHSGSKPYKYKIFDSPDYALPPPYTWEEDAQCSLFGAIDTDGDDKKDLLLIKAWSHPFKNPRSILAYSLLKKEIEWYFPVPGPPSKDPLLHVSHDDTLIIYFSSAPVNGRSVVITKEDRFTCKVNRDLENSDTLYTWPIGDPNLEEDLKFGDWNTYVIAIDIRGNIVWHKKLFEWYSNAYAVLKEKNGAQQLYIFGDSYLDKFRHESDTTRTDHQKIMHLDITTGDSLNQIILSKNMKSLPSATSFENDLVVCDTSKGIIHYFDSNLEIRKSIELGIPVRKIITLNNKTQSGPAYKVIFQDGKVRIYEPGFKHFSESSISLDNFNSYYIAHSSPNTYNAFFGKLQKDFTYSLFTHKQISAMLLVIITFLALMIILLLFYWIFPWWFHGQVRKTSRDITSPTIIIDDAGIIRDYNSHMEKFLTMDGSLIRFKHCKEVFQKGSVWGPISSQIEIILAKLIKNQICEPSFPFTYVPERDNYIVRRRYSVEVNNIKKNHFGYKGIILRFNDITKSLLYGELDTYLLVERATHYPKNCTLDAEYFSKKLYDLIENREKTNAEEIFNNLKAAISNSKYHLEKALETAKLGLNVIENNTLISRKNVLAKDFYEDFNEWCHNSLEGKVVFQPFDNNDFKVSLAVDDFKNALYNIVENGYQCQPDDNVEVSAEIIEKPNNRMLKINIKDHGHGISPENRKVIFKPGFTTKSTQGGTGLGLHYTLVVVVHHDADILVDSETGEGTTFSVLIPEVLTKEC